MMDVELARRAWLQRAGVGLGALGLSQLLVDSGAACGATDSPLGARSPHFPGKAKRVIHFFLNGGPSHVDTFDPKPALERSTPGNLHRYNCRTERQDRGGVSLAVQVPAIRAERAGSERHCSTRRHGSRGRHRGDPVDVRPGSESRAFADADELRRFDSAAAERRLVGDVRPGDRRTRISRVSSRCVPAGTPSRTLPRTGSRVFCPAPIRGHSSTAAASADRQADREYSHPARGSRAFSGDNWSLLAAR
jgi:hypothetical protein